jgi:Restriction endonuclease
MPSTSLHQTKAIADIADLLYDFLPGSSAWPGAYTWANLTQDVGIPQFWAGGSKKPAITAVLEKTLSQRPEKFCPLILGAVTAGLKYRQKKQTPVQREEILDLNRLLHVLGFVVQELQDRSFLESLPARPKPAPEAHRPATVPTDVAAQAVRAEALRRIRDDFYRMLTAQDAQQRGYDFERLLSELFALEKVAPRGSFRVLGEQIDGSFSVGDAVYLVEARWCKKQADAPDLYVLKEKVDGKSAWTRGLFISVNGFTAPAAATFSKGRVTNLITMDGQDLTFILEDRWTLAEAIEAKKRHAGETGDIWLPLAQAEKPRK